MAKLKILTSEQFLAPILGSASKTLILMFELMLMSITVEKIWVIKYLLEIAREHESQSLGGLKEMSKYVNYNIEFSTRNYEKENEVKANKIHELTTKVQNLEEEIHDLTTRYADNNSILIEQLRKDRAQIMGKLNALQMYNEMAVTPFTYM